MYKFFRIFFTILSALFITAAFIVGVYLPFSWTIACALAALLCFMLVLFFKQKQEEQEKTEENEKTD